VPHAATRAGALPAPAAPGHQTFFERFLDAVERLGNKVPHPVVVFLILMAIVAVVSHLLARMGVSVSFDAINPDTDQIEHQTAAVKSLLSSEGLRFAFAEVVPNLMGFNAIGVILVAMVGVGIADESGLIKALIRKLVAVSPSWALTYILVFVGVMSSIAADAGYLVLIPLAGAAFLSVGRNPIAGIAAGFAGVAAAFSVNMLIKPLDGILTELTNDAIATIDPSRRIDLTANLFFSIASVIVVTIVIALITDKLTEPRLGKYGGERPADAGREVSGDEAKGLKYAMLGLVAGLVIVAALALPRGAPLRNPETGGLIGQSPFMTSLIVSISLVFLLAGLGYGRGARTLTGSTNIMKAIEKTIAGLGGLIFLLLVISQFVAQFNYTNMATVAAVKMGDVLEQANIAPLWLLVGFVGVVAVLDLIMTGAIPKWAIFAPIFVPLFLRLDMDPEAVMAAYRVGDSPVNAITPLNAYFALIVTFAQKYDKNAGVGTVVALMLPYVIVLFVVWTLLLAAWHLLGLPYGPG
jgi:aminobenzoyl-glutamate transport protein